MTFTHIFFDLDGTLIDSSEGIHNGFVQTFEDWAYLFLATKKFEPLWDHL